MRKDPLVILRELAKTDYYQSLYNSAKDLGLQIFENKTQLTKIQLWFLSYIAMYSSINLDIATEDVSDKVLDNVIYEDAYLHYKRKKKIKNKNKRPMVKAKTETSEKEVVRTSSWVLKRTKKQ